MARHDIPHQFDPASGRHVGQANDAGVRSTPGEYQVTEVLVDGDEDAALAVRHLQQVQVAWILTPFPGANHVVPFRTKPFRQTSSRTSVHKELH